jgi:hypothetical protein
MAASATALLRMLAKSARSNILRSAHHFSALTLYEVSMIRGTAGNIDRQSLRGFLHMVESEYPDELLRISEPIDPRFDMTAIVFELDRAGKNRH